MVSGAMARNRVPVPRSMPSMPRTLPPSVSRRVTRAGVQTSTPAAWAASSSSASRTVLRGAYSADMPPLGRMSTVSMSSPYANSVEPMAGVPASTTLSSRPQRCSCSTPPRISAWVDKVSVPGRDASMTSTRMPPRARSIAVAAPEHRPPTTIAS
jgi:hypothetical protein